MVKVWIADWEMQCCGKPFSIGDKVTWAVSDFDFDVSYVEKIGKIDYQYDEHHSADDEIMELTGKVQSIGKIYQKYSLEHNSEYNRDVYVPVSGKLESSTEQATGYEKNQDEYKFSAYLVTLEV